ncbi:carboxylesterase type B [Pestalotiopsis sp. NC0098]|nr:carboxylesterase type B [Pestalotiopsis sp. NC0098]
MQLLAWKIFGLAILGRAHAQNLTIDLGYEKYTGVHNETTSLNTWKGVRYAAAPVGNLSFRAPVAPEKTGSTILADSMGPACLQANPAGAVFGIIEGASQDCLFLNVYAPFQAQDLPVFVYIHGGGYGEGDGRADPSYLFSRLPGQFVMVAMNYRLGVFGFLSSEDVKENGDLNAGILDQRFALEWVQKYIHLFGGDKSRVTLFGDSAGGGSVMLHAMAYGGTDGDRLFQQAIGDSPYLPLQYNYDDDYTTYLYDQFVSLSGCEDADDKLACLRETDIEILDEANVNVTLAGLYGTWSFAPVTDGELIRTTPSVQLNEQKAVNGRIMWASHNADEAPFFTPANITTEDNLVDFIQTIFPLFDDDDISTVLETYPLSDYGKNTSNPLFATAGDSGPTAVEVSPFAIGNQQRAYAIYAEVTFVCPAYWLANAYTGGSNSSYSYNNSKTSYLHTYTNPPALHAYDTMAYFAPPPPYQGPAFAEAMQATWGAFITTGSPNIPASVANNSGSDVLSHWPVWGHDRMVVFNQTGGVLASDEVSGWNVTDHHDPGLRNDFREVDARAWEGGRGDRCDFWVRMGPKARL